MFGFPSVASRAPEKGIIRMKVFVSYSHKQGEWVRNSLVPVLRASGVHVLVDWDRFRVGRAVVGEMDDTQGQADRHLLVITSDYLVSKYCRHEMDLAIKLDTNFPSGKVLPVKLDDMPLPNRLKNVLYVELRDLTSRDQWQRLIMQSGGSGMDPPDWLAARDKVANYLTRNECVNLIIDSDVNWFAVRHMIESIRDLYINDLVHADLSQDTSVTR
jgi:hypothetical protein